MSAVLMLQCIIGDRQTWILMQIKISVALHPLQPGRPDA